MANTNDALPTYDVAIVDDQIGFFKTLFKLHDLERMTCLPAIVEEYDGNAHIATVKPLVKFMVRKENGEEPIDRPSYKVPVYHICRGGYAIDMPMFVGDTGMLFAVDREWNTARKENSAELTEDQQKDGNGENKGAFPPDSHGLTDFEYGFFLPMSFSKSESSPSDGIVIRKIVDDSEDDDIISEISLSKESLKIVAGETKYEIKPDGIFYEGEGGETVETLSDIRYDLSTHQFQKKVRTDTKLGTFIVNVGEVSDWQKITGGQAVPVPTSS